MKKLNKLAIIGPHKSGTKFCRKILINNFGKENVSYKIDVTGSPFNFYEKNIINFKKEFKYNYLLFIIREKQEYLNSLYSFYIKVGGKDDFISFSQKENVLLKINHNMIKKKLIKHFSDRIIFVDFSEMTQKSKKFISKISKISGIKVNSFNMDFSPTNVSDGNFSTKIKRLINLYSEWILLKFFLILFLHTFQFIKKRVGL